MKEKTKITEALSLAVDKDVFVRVYPDDKHDFLMTSRQVASGYGISPPALTNNKQRHEKELLEGIHFIKVFTNSEDPSKVLPNSHSLRNAQPNQIYWTKAGIIRLGFFIRSERAKLFRDWAERLILRVDEQKDLFGNIVAVSPRKTVQPLNSRLKQSDITSILADVCEIEDKDLRMRIVNKLTKGGIQ